MDQKRFPIEKIRTGMIADSQFPEKMFSLVLDLSCGHRNLHRLINGEDFSIVETIPSIPRFLDNSGEVVSYCPERICTSAEADELRMIPVSFCPTLKHFLCQKSFSPNRQKSLPIEITGM